jgi:Transcription factor zinc-finger
MSWKPGLPSHDENEWFARRDAEWLKEQRARLDAERAEREKEMHCPRDGTALAHRPFKDVSLDYCPTCHGVWLDSGELALLAHESERNLLRIAKELDGAGRMG